MPFYISTNFKAVTNGIGAAMGIACLCRKKGKKASIVLDLQANAAERLVEEIAQVPEYREVFISGQDALLMADNRSILIVVDTNRPDQVECKPLLEAITKVCVIDHHRRAADYISPVVVNLHEPYASSASELVTELVMYAVDSKDVLPIEAKSMLAGICLDTKFFVSKETGDTATVEITGSHCEVMVGENGLPIEYDYGGQIWVVERVVYDLGKIIAHTENSQTGKKNF